MKKFKSNFIDLGGFGDKSLEDVNILKNEPMFFGANLEFALKNGGSITKSFFDSIPEDWKDGPLIFDSRVHMLMKGWYPAIPGYHHDDVPRHGTYNQPNYVDPEYRSEHLMGLVNGHIAPTMFAVGECVMPEVSEGEIVYENWHREVSRQIKDNILTSVEAPTQRIIYFDDESFHTAQGAVMPGWRWFGRVSRHTARTDNPPNEIRKQVQVYLSNPMGGW